MTDIKRKRTQAQADRGRALRQVMHPLDPEGPPIKTGFSETAGTRTRRRSTGRGRSPIKTGSTKTAATRTRKRTISREEPPIMTGFTETAQTLTRKRTSGREEPPIKTGFTETARTRRTGRGKPARRRRTRTVSE